MDWNLVWRVLSASLQKPSAVPILHCAVRPSVQRLLSDFVWLGVRTLAEILIAGLRIRFFTRFSAYLTRIVVVLPQKRTLLLVVQPSTRVCLFYLYKLLIYYYSSRV